MKKVTLLALAVLIGTASCKNKETDSAETSDPELVAMHDGDRYDVNLQKSNVNWKAYHKGGVAPRWGTLKISDGKFFISHNNITSGHFVIDFTTLVVDPASVTEKDKKAMDLQNHLKSEDFFNVERFPNATFDITGITDFDPEVHTSVIEGVNKMVSGNLNLIGKPLNITFPARVTLTDSSASVIALFAVDRTSWGISFGTTDPNPALWGISKDIEVGINLTAEKN